VYDINGFFPIPITFMGQQVNIFGEAEIMEILKDMNVAFNEHNIFFKYKGYDVTLNSGVSNSEQTQSISSLGLHDYTAYNIYIVNSARIGSAFAFLGNTFAVFSYSSLLDYYRPHVLGHELGHALTLLHVFNNWSPPIGTECEHVTRDPGHEEYNADDAGDYVHDTPAQSPQSWFTNCVYNYTEQTTDCQGTPYENIIAGNYLASGQGPDCGHHFTPGQVVRMRTHLQSPSMAHVLQTYNTIESLYEPFETIPFGGNIIRSVIDNNDGTAEVCRNMLIKHRFQKSFDYVFTNVNQSDLSAATINDLPEIINTTYTFGVQINQVNPETLNEVFVDCNREPFCQTEDFIKGSIISTKVLGSMNLTLEELNQIQVKDPDLYENLMKEYYHIIRKETESGAMKQTTIYKY